MIAKGWEEKEMGICCSMGIVSILQHKKNPSHLLHNNVDIVNITVINLLLHFGGKFNIICFLPHKK